MRGWKVGGMGLRDGTDGLGGDLAWAMGLSVFSPIPKKEHWGLRLHGFMNVGKVVRYRSGMSSCSSYLCRDRKIIGGHREFVADAQLMQPRKEEEGKGA